MEIYCIPNLTLMYWLDKNLKMNTLNFTVYFFFIASIFSSWSVSDLPVVYDWEACLQLCHHSSPGRRSPLQWNPPAHWQDLLGWRRKWYGEWVIHKSNPFNNNDIVICNTWLWLRAVTYHVVRRAWSWINLPTLSC